MKCTLIINNNKIMVAIQHRMSEKSFMTFASVP